MRLLTPSLLLVSLIHILLVRCIDEEAAKNPATPPPPKTDSQKPLVNKLHSANATKPTAGTDVDEVNVDPDVANTTNATVAPIPAANTTMSPNVTDTPLVNTTQGVNTTTSVTLPSPPVIIPEVETTEKIKATETSSTSTTSTTTSTTSQSDEPSSATTYKPATSTITIGGGEAADAEAQSGRSVAVGIAVSGVLVLIIIVVVVIVCCLKRRKKAEAAKSLKSPNRAEASWGSWQKAKQQHKLNSPSKLSDRGVGALFSSGRRNKSLKPPTGAATANAALLAAQPSAKEDTEKGYVPVGPIAGNGEELFRIPGDDIKYSGPLRMYAHLPGPQVHGYEHGEQKEEPPVNKLVFDRKLNECAAIGEGVEIYEDNGSGSESNRTTFFPAPEDKHRSRETSSKRRTDKTPGHSGKSGKSRSRSDK